MTTLCYGMFRWLDPALFTPWYIMYMYDCPWSDPGIVILIIMSALCELGPRLTKKGIIQLLCPLWRTCVYYYQAYIDIMLLYIGVCNARRHETLPNDTYWITYRNIYQDPVHRQICVIFIEWYTFLANRLAIRLYY